MDLSTILGDLHFTFTFMHVCHSFCFITKNNFLCVEYEFGCALSSVTEGDYSIRKQIKQANMKTRSFLGI